MKRNVFAHPGRVVALWAILLTAAVAGLGAANYQMAQYLAAARERDPQYDLNRADRLMNEGNFPEAFRAVAQALRKAPSNPDCHRTLGHVLFNFRYWDEAVAAYRNAIARGSADQGIRTNAIWAYIELEKYEDAVELGKHCLAEGFNAPQFARYIAEAYARSNKTTEAISYLELALEGQPEDLFLLTRLAVFYEATGAPKKAQRARKEIDRIQAGISSVTYDPRHSPISPTSGVVSSPTR